MAEEDSFTSAMAKKANEYYDSLYPKAVAKPVGILAKLPWLKTLDADQQQNAILVAEEAKKQGVPVNYALSVANAESGLMHDLSKPSKKGAIGIMQLLPTTAQEGNMNRDLPKAGKCPGMQRTGHSILLKMQPGRTGYHLQALM